MLLQQRVQLKVAEAWRAIVLRPHNGSLISRLLHATARARGADPLLEMSMDRSLLVVLRAINVMGRQQPHAM